MKKLPGFALLLLLSTALAACGEALPVSSGGVVEKEPIRLEWGEVYEGPLQGDQAFILTVADGAILTFDIESMEGVVTYRLSSPDAPIVADNVRIRMKANFTVVLDDRSGGEYELLVRGFDAAYRLSAAQSIQNDGESGGDAPSSPENGVMLDPGRVYTGDVGVNDDTDAYRFNAPPHAFIRLEVTNPDSSLRGFSLRGFADGEEVFTPDPTPPDDTDIWVESLPGETTYSFTVVGTGASYEISLMIEPADDGGGGGDAGDSLPSATPVTPGVPIIGHLSQGDTDCFLLNVEEPGRYELSTFNLPDPNGLNRGSINIFLREADSRRLVKSQLVQFDERIDSVETVRAGEHFICVVNDSPLAFYEITFQPFVEQ